MYLTTTQCPLLHFLSQTATTAAILLPASSRDLPVEAAVSIMVEQVIRTEETEGQVESSEQPPLISKTFPLCVKVTRRRILSRMYIFVSCHTDYTVC